MSLFTHILRTTFVFMLCFTCWATDNIVVTSTGDTSLNLQKLREDLDRLQAHVYTALPLDSPDSIPQTSQDSEGALEKLEGNRSTAQLSVKLESLRNEIAELRGKLEEAEHTAELQAAKFEKLEQRLAAKIAEDKDSKTPVEPAKEAEAPTEESKSIALTPRDIIINDIKTLNPQAAYDKAKEYISQGDYERAEIALHVFVETFPEHDLRGAAYYYLGEIYYIQKKFKEAASMFAESYKTQPQGSKAPDALLKMAQSFEALNQPKEACATLGQLKKVFPKMDSGLKIASRNLSTHLKCLSKEPKKGPSKDLSKDK